MNLKVLIALLLISSAFMQGCGGNSPDHILIETTAGDMEVQLFPEKAPKTVSAFLSYVDSGFYDNSSFYRILSRDNQPTGANAAELIQGGIYKTGNRRDYLQGIPHEPTSQTGILHQHGTISLARLEPGTAGTEFFICIGDNPSFNAGWQNRGDTLGYAAFGRVIKGLDVLMSIYNRPEVDQEFTPPVGIIKIVRK